jgi:hypothetical protein
MLRYLSHPRWIWWHLLTVTVTYGFGRLGYWQWERRVRIDDAQRTVIDWQNTFYAFQWWVFAGFVVWFWWKFLVDSYRLANVSEKK